MKRCLLLLAILSSFQWSWAQRYVLANANVVDLRQGMILAKKQIVIQGLRIEAILDEGQTVQGNVERRFDLRGQYVMPPFWDMMTQPSIGREWHDLMLAQGITGTLSYQINPDSLSRWQELRKQGRVIPRILGMASPLDLPTELQSSDAGLNAWLDYCSNIRQMGYRGIELPQALSRSAFLTALQASEQSQLISSAFLPLGVSLSEASRKGLDICLGMEGLMASSSAKEEYLRDVAWGVREDSSLFSYSKLRDFLLESYSPTKSDSITFKIGRSSLALTPLISEAFNRAQLRDSSFYEEERITLIPPTLRKEWYQGRDWSYLSEEFCRAEMDWFELTSQRMGRFEVCDIKILPGSGQGMPFHFPGYSYHDELAFMVEGGMTIRETLRNASVYPINFLGLGQDLGSIETGKIASMVILKRNPLLDIRHTREVEGIVLDGKYIQKLALQVKVAKIRDRHQRKEIIPILLEAYEKQGVEGLSTRYQSLESEDVFKRNYNFDENSLRKVGLYLQEEIEDLDAAIEVFQLNAAAYPRSAWVYLNLGRAYAAHDNLQLATQNLEKCLQLDPQISEARTILDRLGEQNDDTDD